MPAGIGYSPDQLAALTTFTGIPPDLLTQLLGRGLSTPSGTVPQTPLDLLARAQGVSKAAFPSQLSGDIERLHASGGQQETLQQLQMIQQLLGAGGGAGRGPLTTTEKARQMPGRIRDAGGALLDALDTSGR